MNVGIENIPDVFYQQPPKYIIVVAPIDDEYSLSQKQEVLRFLDILKDKVVQSIPASMFSRVSVIPLQTFV